MIDKLVASDLASLGADARTGIPPLVLTPEPVAAPAQVALLPLASAYAAGIARMTFAGAALAFLAGSLVLSRVMTIDSDIGGLRFVFYVLAVAAIVSITVRRRAEERFAREVARERDPIDHARHLVTRLDGPVFAMSVAGITAFAAAVPTLICDFNDDLFRIDIWGGSPPSWQWVQAFQIHRVEELLLMIGVVTVLAFAISRFRDRLQRLAHPAFALAALVAALVIFRITLQTGMWSVESADDRPRESDATAALVVSTVVTFIGATSLALRRRKYVKRQRKHRDNW